MTGSLAELAPEQLPEVYFEKPLDLEAFMAAVTYALARPARAGRQKGAT